MVKLKKDKKVYMIGGGGHSKIVYECLKLNDYNLAGYCSLKKSKWLENIGVNFFSQNEIERIASNGEQFVISFVGKNSIDLVRRFELMEKIKSLGGVFPNIIHKSSSVSKFASISDGVQVLAGAVVNSFSKISQGAIINSGAIVEHDVELAEGVHLAPGAIALGSAKIGKFSYIGASAIVLPNTKVRSKSFVKAQEIKS